MSARRLTNTLTFWTSAHPAWQPNPEWPEQVGFVTWESPTSYVFIDPLVRDDLDPTAWEYFDGAVSRAGQPVSLLLTAPWHERSSRAVAARYDALVWIHPRGRSRVADLKHLQEPPPGINVFVPAGVDEGQVAFHIVTERALVVAEFLLGTDRGLQVLPSPGTTDLAAFTDSLDLLLGLEVDFVLVSHGPPVLEHGDDAIRLALDAFRRDLPS
jgi:glyoxylase-like metal-dependent hydrolase (beta-lactamase superfamily II)